jgi:hypothetical protein
MPIVLPLLPLTVMLWGVPVGRAVRAGVTTDEIDRIVYEACIERYASFLLFSALSRQGACGEGDTLSRQPVAHLGSLSVSLWCVGTRTRRR